jgi:hypothetical protein
MTSWFKSAALALGALVILAGPALAGTWDGVWKVKDSGGTPFEITLTPDGKASASLHEDMVGTWKEEGGAAVISWKTGWTTKIEKSGEGFTKTGYRKGAPLTGKPSNSSPAEKVK